MINGENIFLSITIEINCKLQKNIIRSVMRRILYMALLLLSTVSLQAQNDGTWKDFLEKIKMKAPKENLQLLRYTYLGKVETEEQFEQLKVKLLAGDNYFPTGKGTVIRLDEFDDSASLNRYKNFVSDILTGIAQLNFGVVELNWQQDSKTFNSYCLVREHSIIFDHIINNIIIVSPKRKIKTITLNVTLSQLKAIMARFFCETLEKNFGVADGESIKMMMDGIAYYESDFIIDVDRAKFKAINDALFKSSLTDYFYDRSRSCGDSTKINNSFQHFMNGRYLIKSDGNTYFQKELLTSEHPFIQEICHLYKIKGDDVFSGVWDKLNANNYNCLYDFETNDEIRMFVTLYFWRYLCYCVNIDFCTGDDKTDFIMKKMDADK